MRASKHFVLFAALFVTLLFVFQNSVHAQGPVGSVPTGTTVDADAFLAAPDVIVDGNVDGDLFAIGQSVTVNGNVTGSVFLVADRATLRGQVGGSVYALASNLNLDTTAKIDHSVYAVALSLLTANGSTITRDLYTLAVGAQFAGKVERTTRAIIGPVEIIRLLMTQFESLQLFSVSMNLPRETAPQSARASNCQTYLGATGASAGFIGNVLECFLNPPQTPPAQTSPTQTDAAANVTKWLLSRTREFIVLVLIGLILVFAFPRQLVNWSKPVQLRPFIAGLIGLFVSVNGFLLTILLVIAVLILGIALQGLTLQMLAVLVWTLGLSILIAAFWIFILFLFYISQVVVANWLAVRAFERFAPNAKVHRVIPMLVGVLVFVLLAAIPVVGAIVSVVAALLGMGGVTLTWFDNLSKRPAQKAPAAA